MRKNEPSRDTGAIVSLPREADVAARALCRAGARRVRRGGAPERVVLWIERREAASGPSAGPMNPQHRQSAEPRADDVIFCEATSWTTRSSRRTRRSRTRSWCSRTDGELATQASRRSRARRSSRARAGVLPRHLIAAQAELRPLRTTIARVAPRSCRSDSDTAPTQTTPSCSGPSPRAASTRAGSSSSTCSATSRR